MFGRVKTVQGLLIEVVGPVRELRVGGRVLIETTNGGTAGRARSSASATAMRFACRSGRSPACGSAARRCSRVTMVPSIRPRPGSGRVINANGEPIDGKGPIARGAEAYPLQQMPLPAHERARVGAPIDLGVRALNTFTTLCEGQRMGIFAGSGVGKSVLMSMLARNAQVDVAIIGLIGERGREVQEFITEYLGEVGIKQRHRRRRHLRRGGADAAAGGVSDADARRVFPRSGQARAVHDGQPHALCAMAQREIGLAIGEPPTAKGYPPTVLHRIAATARKSRAGAPKLGLRYRVYLPF